MGTVGLLADVVGGGSVVDNLVGLCYTESVGAERTRQVWTPKDTGLRCWLKTRFLTWADVVPLSLQGPCIRHTAHVKSWVFAINRRRHMKSRQQLTLFRVDPTDPSYLQATEEATLTDQVLSTVAFSSMSNEYFTPSRFVEAARFVMGGIDLDPASCPEANKIIKARRFYTKEDNGLQLSAKWRGRVWMNPPYGKLGNQSSQFVWTRRLIREFHHGGVTQAVFLLRAAPGYDWFERLWDVLPLCFVRERVSFIRPDGTSDGVAKQGTVLGYLGPQVGRWAQEFVKFGRVILPDQQINREKYRA